MRVDFQILKETKRGWAIWFLKGYDGRYRLMVKPPSLPYGKEVFGFGGRNDS